VRLSRTGVWALALVSLPAASAAEVTVSIRAHGLNFPDPFPGTGEPLELGG
jgi:hypothetical protein